MRTSFLLILIPLLLSAQDPNAAAQDPSIAY